MSGEDIIDLAENVIQIAELGSKISVKLYTFTRKVRSTSKSIDALSQDIATHGAVLQQLGRALEKDKGLKVCSRTAIDTATNLVNDTRHVFERLEILIESEERCNIRSPNGLTSNHNLSLTSLEPKIDEVQANIERLKSSLLVILNILILAEQYRTHEALPILQEQRELIKILHAEKNENEKRYNAILRAITDKPESHEYGSVSIAGNAQVVLGNFYQASMPANEAFRSVRSTDQKFAEQSTIPHVAVIEPPSPASRILPRTSKDNIVVPHIDLPASLKHHHKRIHHHTHLVQNLLSEISSLQYAIDHGSRDRMHNGILDIHWNEWAPQRKNHAQQHFEKIFCEHEDVAQYWSDRYYCLDEQIPQVTAYHDNTYPRSFTPLGECETVKRKRNPNSQVCEGELDDFLYIPLAKRRKTTEDRYSDSPKLHLGYNNGLQFPELETLVRQDDTGRSCDKHLATPPALVAIPNIHLSSDSRHDSPVRPKTSRRSAFRGRNASSISQASSFSGNSGVEMSDQPSTILSPKHYRIADWLRNLVEENPAISSASLGLEAGHQYNGGFDRMFDPWQHEEEYQVQPEDDYVGPAWGDTRFLHFQDALGWNHKIPWQQCQTWCDMECFLRQKFADEPRLKKGIDQGQYDLFGPNWENILPQYWEESIQPGIAVRMQMWFLPQPERGTERGSDDLQGYVYNDSPSDKEILEPRITYIPQPSFNFSTTPEIAHVEGGWESPSDRSNIFYSPSSQENMQKEIYRADTSGDSLSEEQSDEDTSTARISNEPWTSSLVQFGSARGRKRRRIADATFAPASRCLDSGLDSEMERKKRRQRAQKRIIARSRSRSDSVASYSRPTVDSFPSVQEWTTVLFPRCSTEIPIHEFGHALKSWESFDWQPPLPTTNILFQMILNYDYVHFIANSIDELKNDRSQLSLLQAVLMIYPLRSRYQILAILHRRLFQTPLQSTASVNVQRMNHVRRLVRDYWVRDVPAVNKTGSAVRELPDPRYVHQQPSGRMSNQHDTVVPEINLMERQHRHQHQGEFRRQRASKSQHFRRRRREKEPYFRVDTHFSASYPDTVSMADKMDLIDIVDELLLQFTTLSDGEIKMRS